VVVGAGVRLGSGDDMSPNREQGDKMTTGVTVVGKGAHIPQGIVIGRNVLVNADRDEDDFPQDEIKSGETI
jgi:glucose-1-phosphate adenylyltransferase